MARRGLEGFVRAQQRLIVVRSHFSGTLVVDIEVTFMNVHALGVLVAGVVAQVADFLAALSLTEQVVLRQDAGQTLVIGASLRERAISSLDLMTEPRLVGFTLDSGVAVAVKSHSVLLLAEE